MTGLPLRFPVLAFVPDYGAWAVEGLEEVERFFEEEDFTKVDRWRLKHRPHLKMILVDSAGRTWRVVGVTDLGAWGTSWMKCLRIVFRTSRRLNYDLIEEAPIPFDQVKERVAASILSHPDHWRDDEAVSGESAPPRDEQEMLDELAAAARQADDLKELIDILTWDEAGRPSLKGAKDAGAGA